MLITAIALSYWVHFARTVRGSTMVERNKEYIQAARVIGVHPARIVVGHLLPNVIGPVLVIATINLATAILTEATLSFLGVGLPPTEPSLGTLIRIGNDFLLSGDWWIIDLPGDRAGVVGAVGQSARRLAARRVQPEAAVVGSVIASAAKQSRAGSPHDDEIAAAPAAPRNDKLK